MFIRLWSFVVRVHSKVLIIYLSPLSVNRLLPCTSFMHVSTLYFAVSCTFDLLHDFEKCSSGLWECWRMKWSNASEKPAKLNIFCRSPVLKIFCCSLNNVQTLFEGLWIIIRACTSIKSSTLLKFLLIKCYLRCFCPHVPTCDLFVEIMQIILKIHYLRSLKFQ